MAGEDRGYVEWIRSLPCAACGTTYGVQAHHHTNGSTAPLFPHEGEPWSSGSPRGRGQRAHDHWALPLCATHHANLHGFHGFFKHLNKETRRQWQDERVRALRIRYLDEETF